MKLDDLTRANHERVKGLVLRALRSKASGGCHQSSLVRLICSTVGVKTLKGEHRKEFEWMVNKAVGALLHEKPPRIVRPNPKSDFIRLLKKPRIKAKSSLVSRKSK